MIWNLISATGIWNNNRLSVQCSHRQGWHGNQSLCSRQGTKDQSTERFPHKPTSGFTLLEILIVVLILGIITSAISLSIDVTGRQKARTLVKEIKFLMNTMSDESILTGNPYGIQWEGENKRMVPVVYDRGLWVRTNNLDTVMWHKSITLSLFIGGISLQEKEQSEQPLNTEDEESKKKQQDLPEIFFWNTGLWDPDGRIEVEMDGLPYAKIQWTASGNFAVKYPDNEEKI